MKKIKIIAALSVLLTGCGGGGGSDESSPANGRSYAHSYSEEVGQCTQFSYTSEELEASSVVTAGECPTSGRIAYCDLSAVLENVNEMRIFYYQGSPFTATQNEQGCNLLGGQYVIGTGVVDEEPSVDEEVELLTVDETATEYQNFLTEGMRTGISEVWNVKRNKIEKFSNDIFEEQYEDYSFINQNHKITIFRKSDTGSGTAFFGFNHRTGGLQQITNTRWGDAECLAWSSYGLLVGKKDIGDGTCWSDSEYGFYIDPYMSETDNPISINFVDDIRYRRVSPVLSINNEFKGYITNQFLEFSKIYLLENNVFNSFVLNFPDGNEGIVEDIIFATDGNFLIKFNERYYLFTLDAVKDGQMGVNITQELANEANITSVYKATLQDKSFLIVNTNSELSNKLVYSIETNGTLLLKANVKAGKYSMLYSVSGFYVMASYEANEDEALFQYYSKSDWVIDASKTFTHRVNGGHCVIQGNESYAFVHGNNVSIGNAEGIVATRENGHLVSLADTNNPSDSLNASKLMIIHSDSYGIHLYDELNSQLVEIENQNVQADSNGSGCYMGSGYYLDDNFFAYSNQFLGPIYGSLTGSVESI